MDTMKLFKIEPQIIRKNNQ